MAVVGHVMYHTVPIVLDTAIDSCCLCDILLQVVEEDDWLSRRLAELNVDSAPPAAAEVLADDGGGIDFGDFDSSTAIDSAGGFDMDAIDFGDVSNDQTDLAEIDFGDLAVDDASTADDSGAADPGAAIDFDIVVEESGTSNDQGTYIFSSHV